MILCILLPSPPPPPPLYGLHSSPSSIIHHPQCFVMLNNSTLHSDPGMSVRWLICKRVRRFVNIMLCVYDECMNILTLLHNNAIVYCGPLLVCGLHSPSSIIIIHSVLLCSTIQPGSIMWSVMGGQYSFQDWYVQWCCKPIWWHDVDLNQISQFLDLLFFE